MRLTVDLRALRRLQARLSHIDRAPLSALAQLLGDESVRQTQQRFSRRVTPDGRRWPPRVDDEPHPLLERSGAMRRSIGVREVGDRGVTIGTHGVPYASVHQHGSGRVPQRQFLGWGEGDLGDLAIDAEQWLRKHVGQVLT